MILLWGMSGDDPFEAIRASLARRGERFVVLDQRDVLATSLELTAGAELGGSVTVGGNSFSLDEIGSVFVRQYDARKLRDVVAAGEEGLARAISIETALWSWTEHTRAHVFNRPSAMASNASKPYQATLIESAGFLTPPTLLTNDPAEACAFWERHGAIVYKSVSSVRSIVSRLDPEAAERLRDVVTCPTQFQKYIAGRDVRVHVVGDALFPSLVASGADDYRYAARQGGSVEMEACELPREIAERCLALSARLQLPLAGIDLRVTPDGEWYCFEVNPSPAFVYYQLRTFQPISETLAQLLIDSDHAHQ
jgi:glutathione synthase/RimK-type ligase-like ATP-grasp enzyme